MFFLKLFSQSGLLNFQNYIEALQLVTDWRFANKSFIYFLMLKLKTQILLGKRQTENRLKTLGLIF